MLPGCPGSEPLRIVTEHPGCCRDMLPDSPPRQELEQAPRHPGRARQPRRLAQSALGLDAEWHPAERPV